MIENEKRTEKKNLMNVLKFPAGPQLDLNEEEFNSSHLNKKHSLLDDNMQEVLFFFCEAFFLFVVFFCIFFFTLG